MKKTILSTILVVPLTLHCGISDILTYDNLTNVGRVIAQQSINYGTALVTAQFVTSAFGLRDKLATLQTANLLYPQIMQINSELSKKHIKVEYYNPKTSTEGIDITQYEQLPNFEYAVENALNGNPITYALAGLPGTGKTTMAKAIAKAAFERNPKLDCKVIIIKGEDGVHRYLEDALKTVKSKIPKTDSANSLHIVVIDECHLFLSETKEKNDGQTYMAEILNSYISSKKKGISWVLTTNYPESLKPSTLSRCDELYIMDTLNSPKALEKVLSNYLKGKLENKQQFTSLQQQLIEQMAEHAFRNPKEFSLRKLKSLTEQSWFNIGFQNIKNGLDRELFFRNIRSRSGWINFSSSAQNNALASLTSDLDDILNTTTEVPITLTDTAKDAIAAGYPLGSDSILGRLERLPNKEFANILIKKINSSEQTFASLNATKLDALEEETRKELAAKQVLHPYKGLNLSNRDALTFEQRKTVELAWLVKKRITLQDRDSSSKTSITKNDLAPVTVSLLSNNYINSLLSARSTSKTLTTFENEDSWHQNLIETANSISDLEEAEKKAVSQTAIFEEERALKKQLRQTLSELNALQNTKSSWLPWRNKKRISRINDINHKLSYFKTRINNLTKQLTHSLEYDSIPDNIQAHQGIASSQIVKGETLSLRHALGTSSSSQD